ncbi:hypothetical protein [Pelosinus propionicus]|uniref:Uncharacterized protein n=1 Tax=Pelosinus propionicus DSM 13327 TaxID=1123291 RepID=A0A1I4L8L5_9FIRM|nr:hypothetical protein [Pelosinus propionicus]SFL87133.1 hypothetical protein SAMN04490355_10234 [Pelosinus propionicus DSM 13327]
MKSFILTIIFFLLLVTQTLAISPINQGIIKEAQDHAKLKIKDSLQEFLFPWIAYEEKAEKLNAKTEHSYLYTPYLLIATDAREKILKGHDVTIVESEEVLENYSGLLSFSTLLFGEKEDFAKDASVVIKQATNIIKAYQMIIPAEGEKVYLDKGQTVFNAQCYFYFFERDIRLDRPIVLSIITTDQKEHNFYFDLGTMK